MRESTKQWARQVAMLARTEIDAIAVEEWSGWWPLPIGRQAVDRVCKELDRNSLFPGYSTLLNLVPFEGDEEALWVLRIEKSGAVLDLFGLAAYEEREDLHRKYGNITKGEVAYVLRGRNDTSLISLVPQAQQWWSAFSKGRRIGGRPRNSGTWASASEFKDSLHAAVHSIREQGRKVTQEEVAGVLNGRPDSTSDSDIRQLRRWLNAFGVDWSEVKNLR